MKTTNLIAVIAISAGLLVGTTAQAKPTQVQLQTLPLKVQKAIKAKAGSDKIVRILRESENGKDVYDVVVNKNGKETIFKVDDTGNYLSTSDQSAPHNDKAETHKH